MYILRKVVHRRSIVSVTRPLASHVAVVDVLELFPVIDEAAIRIDQVR
jgi:hypothetical protein